MVSQETEKGKQRAEGEGIDLFKQVRQIVKATFRT